MPSESCAVQIGVMALSAAAVSRQLRPAILPLSSIRKIVSNCVRKAYGESSVICIAPGTAAEFVGGEYAGGAGSLRCLGRRVGVVVANGFVILFDAAGAVGDTLDEGDLVDGENDGGNDGGNDGVNDDLESFLEPNFFKLKGMLSLEDVLVCEQNVGAGEITILTV
jgi:hypothetical protein